MQVRINNSHEYYSNVFIVYEEYDKVIWRTRDRFGTQIPEKQKLSPNTNKKIMKILDPYKQE